MLPTRRLVVPLRRPVARGRLLKLGLRHPPNPQGVPAVDTQPPPPQLPWPRLPCLLGQLRPVEPFQVARRRLLRVMPLTTPQRQKQRLHPPIDLPQLPLQLHLQHFGYAQLLRRVDPDVQRQAAGASLLIERMRARLVLVRPMDHEQPLELPDVAAPTAPTEPTQLPPLRQRPQPGICIPCVLQTVLKSDGAHPA